VTNGINISKMKMERRAVSPQLPSFSLPPSRVIMHSQNGQFTLRRCCHTAWLNAGRYWQNYAHVEVGRTVEADVPMYGCRTNGPTRPITLAAKVCPRPSRLIDGQSVICTCPATNNQRDRYGPDCSSVWGERERMGWGMRASAMMDRWLSAITAARVKCAA